MTNTILARIREFITNKSSGGHSKQEKFPRFNKRCKRVVLGKILPNQILIIATFRYEDKGSREYWSIVGTRTGDAYIYRALNWQNFGIALNNK